MVWWITGGVLALGLLATAAAAFVLAQQRWHARQTDGTAYFGRTRAERRAFKETLRRRARFLVPAVRAVGLVHRLPMPVCEYRGVTGPGLACSAQSYAAAAAYRPGPTDVFVATQMKCGTTWMQQVVYEVLMRGRGDFGDGGHRHLYATSPWIESTFSVPVEDAPRLGARGARLIKTHMPVQLCPYGEQARYVYVTRDPVACFASCVDFIRMLSGPMAWTLPELLDWYCSDRMWWRSWPEHVEGWWRWSEERGNVLFIHYEEMLDDLPGVVGRVSAFLDAGLTPEELARVTHKSGFEYMKAHEELFEMAPPNFFSVGGGSFFVSGRRDRGRDVGPAERERILAFCRERLRGARYPAARFYPELAQDRA